MSCYTLSCSLLKGVIYHKPYIVKILFHFLDENPYKVVVDKSKKILDLYEDAAKNDKSGVIYTWIELMAKRVPDNFEYINVDLTNVNSEEELFLKVCRHTKNENKILVFSHQEWEMFDYSNENFIEYDSTHIEVFDRDEAVSELHPIQSGDTYNIKESNFANRGSRISRSKINSKDEPKKKQ
ncbi:hypothetical protein [Fibrella forsythiae]|uniref:Uncharacterized protein n=1 Tax=Fibrella forsythiae TaxID=2817061 RepID=A0ABS3JSN2_9BACT|nr:hypothetical protein [Fibrella forsythiae]MBO0952988.1 hypothetical protein [Fibrella forsythiae]